ncbi:hypothetical protein [Evansella clarkii]|uniref:hypothetical protein n=1 Tax=Evansella clarkii TaxID=79879 RepID=UPI000996230A|nr:hypothetical protein [Evansella clarkii]
MSKPLTLRLKWKIFRQYLKEIKDGVIVNCAYCSSLDIRFDKQLEHNINDRRVYTSSYTCNNCGAKCKNIQEWTKNASEPEDGNGRDGEKSLNGTKWLCTDENRDEYGMTCTVIEGFIHPDWNGENEIEIKYEDGSIAYMKYRRFAMRFERIG